MSKKESTLFNVTIDGVEVQVPSDATILEAAQEAGVDIPFLCHEERLRPFGACRICLVNVEGMRGRLIPACTTPVGPNMVVTTSNEAIDKARRTVLELLLVHHPLDCPVCDKAGECKLQDLVYKYGPTENRYLYGQTRFQEKMDNRSPFIERNNNRCVLCGACARICNEVQAVGEISFTNRGFAAAVGTSFDQSLDCEFCGQCVSACPVGALNNKMFANRSRVWDLEKTPTVCGICGNGCSYVVETRNNEIFRITHETNLGINGGILCGKGRFGYNFLTGKNRITAPLIKKNGEFVESSWDEALDVVAEKMLEILQKDGPAAMSALGSPHGTNEDAKALRLLFGDLLRVKNIDSQARYLLAPTIEVVGENTGTMEDIDNADLVLIVDSATTNSQPVLGNKLIRKMRIDEIPMIVVDSRRTKQARFAEVWLGNAPGTSGEVLAGVLKAAGKADAAEYKDAIEKNVTEVSGVSAELLKKAAALLNAAKNPVIVLGTIPFAESTSAKTARMVYHMAKEIGAKIVVPSEKANLRGLLKYGVCPIGDGFDATEMIDQASQGTLKGMFICGENPVVNFPAGADVSKALANLKMLVVSDLFMTETAKLADVVLPAAASFEKSGTFTNFEGREQKANAAVKAPGQARPDVDILLDLANRLRHSVGMEDVDRVEPTNNWNEPRLPELNFNAAVRPVDRPLVLITGPVLFHCGTLTTHSPELCDVYSEAKFSLNLKDAKAAGIKKGDRIRLLSASGEAVGLALPSRNIPEGNVFAPLHFGGAGVNNLFGGEERGELVFVKIEKA